MAETRGRGRPPGVPSKPSKPKDPNALKTTRGTSLVDYLVNAPPEPPPVLADTPVLDGTGKKTNFTLPVLGMTKAGYDREMLALGRRSALAGFLKTLDLTELKFALARHDTPKANKFLASLVDPANAEFDIVELALFHKIGLSELMSIWRSDRLTMAMSSLFNGLPNIAIDTALDARSITVCCSRCDGAGSVQVHREEGLTWITCPTCEGAGNVRKVGDLKSREQIFKATGIIHESPGININLGDRHRQVNTVENLLDDFEEDSNTIQGSCSPVEPAEPKVESDDAS